MSDRPDNAGAGHRGATGDDEMLVIDGIPQDRVPGRFPWPSAHLSRARPTLRRGQKAGLFAVLGAAPIALLLLAGGTAVVVGQSDTVDVPAAVAPPAGGIEPAPPPAAPRANPAPQVADGPCLQEQLALTVDGWDSAMGTSSARLVVTNTGTATCHLDGYPSVRLQRGAEDLWLATTQAAPGSGSAPAPKPGRVRLPAGGAATASLTWKGYRQQADQTSPQTVVVRARGGVATDGEPYARSTLQVQLTGSAPRIDLVEGAPLTVGPWETWRVSGG